MCLVRRRERACVLRPVVFLTAAAWLFASATARAEDVTIFAAASLTDALDAAIAAYRETAGDRIVPVYASTSILARQIEAGAPAALFFAANVAWVAYLEERGFVVPGSRVDRLGNRLTLAAPADSLHEPPRADLPDITALLGNGRLAIADPDHVPAGQYAKKALQSLGVWRTVAARTVRTANVRAAVALIDRGEVPLGVVYRTDLGVCPGCREVATLPIDSHPPIVYPLVMIAGNRTAAAEAFHAFLLTDRASGVFREFGFVPTR